MFLLSFPSFDVWRACIINQVVCSIPTNGRYVFQVTFNNTNFFYSIPTQVFTEKFTLADSRNTQGGSTISLLIKKRLLRHPRMHSHVYRRLLLAVRTGVHTYSCFKAKGRTQTKVLLQIAVRIFNISSCFFRENAILYYFI